jgi:hypothetical protein
MSGEARGGDDTLTGGPFAGIAAGRDTLIGDAETMLDHARGGNDVLVSGKGTELMYGDAIDLAPTARGGHDRFVFGPENGQDTIGDFRHGEDKIDLRPLGIDNFANLDIETSGADSIIHLDATNQITVANNTDLVASDFIFSRSAGTPEATSATVTEIGDFDGDLGDRQIAGNQIIDARAPPSGDDGPPQVAIFGDSGAGLFGTIFGDSGGDIRDHARGGNDVLSGVVGGLSIAQLREFGDTGADIRDHGRGGNDVLLSGSSDRAVFLFGDAGGNLRGAANGGNDILISHGLAASLAGDAGDDMFDRARGGNDVLMHDRAGFGALVFGDASGEMHDHTRGGNDVLSLSHAPGTLSFGNAAYGDAQGMSGRSVGGNDLLIALVDSATVRGDAGAMSGHARGGNDTLTGSTAGTITLIGDADAMLDRARGGNDLLVSGTATEVMYGDAIDLAPTARGGHDRFAFGPENGQDTIADFRHGEDKIDLRPLGIDSFASLDVQTSGADSIIHLDGTNQITVSNNTHLVASDFIFS